MTVFFVILSNSKEFASVKLQTFLANSMTAHCKPRQIPKKGILFSLTYLIAAIFPSIPREPKPGPTSIPSIPWRISAMFSSVFLQSF